MKLLTLEEVRERVPLSESTLRQAIADRELPATKLRNRWLVDEADLEGWVAAGRPKRRETLPVARRRRPARASTRPSSGGSLRTKLKLMEGDGA